MDVNNINPELRTILIQIGQKLRVLRKEKSELNYIEFAKQLKEDGVPISKNSLQRIEAGDIDYGILSLLSLLKYYKVKPDDFFKDLMDNK